MYYFIARLKMIGGFSMDALESFLNENANSSAFQLAELVFKLTSIFVFYFLGVV